MSDDAPTYQANTYATATEARFADGSTGEQLFAFKQGHVETRVYRRKFDTSTPCVRLTRFIDGRVKQLIDLRPDELAGIAKSIGVVAAEAVIWRAAQEPRPKAPRTALPQPQSPPAGQSEASL